MDASELVNETAAKINFDKRFLVGVAVGAAVVGSINLVALAKKKIAAKRAENDLEDSE